MNYNRAYRKRDFCLSKREKLRKKYFGCLANAVVDWLLVKTKPHATKNLGQACVS